jgi:hypothetical protein
MDEFSYYMVRIRHSPVEDRPEPPLAGIVERLGSGEKQNFADGEELLRLLWVWTERLPNMGPVARGSKA